MIRLTSPRTAAGILALGTMLGAGLMNAIPASAGTHPSGPAAAAPIAKPVQENCTKARKSWVHITRTYGTHTATKCFSGNGLLIFSPEPVLNDFCSGNNYGLFVIENIQTGHGKTIKFNPGFERSYPAIYDLVDLKINRSSGHHSC